MGSTSSREISSIIEDFSDLREDIKELKSSRDLNWRLSVLQDFLDLEIEN